MPSPSKGHCDLRHLDVASNNLCDLFDAVKPGDRLPARCTFCLHFVRKPKKKNSKKDIKNNK